MPVKKAPKKTTLKKTKKAVKTKKSTLKKPKTKKEKRVVGGAAKDRDKKKTAPPEIPPEPPELPKEDTPEEEENGKEHLETEILDELPEELRKVRDKIPTGKKPGQRGPGRPPKPAEGFQRLVEIFETDEYQNLETLTKPWTNALDGFLQLFGKEFALSENEKKSHTTVWASYLALAKPEDIDPEKMINWTIFLMYLAIIARRGPKGYEKVENLIEEFKKRRAEEEKKAQEEKKRKQQQKKEQGK